MFAPDRTLRLGFALALALGCFASAAASAPSEVDALRQRVESYWQARVAQSEAMYDYFVPEAKGGPSREEVRVAKQILFESFSVDGLEVTDNRGTVDLGLRIRFAVPLPPAFAERAKSTQKLREAWVRVDGVWYKGVARGGLNDLVKAAPKVGGEGSSGKGGE